MTTFFFVYANEILLWQIADCDAYNEISGRCMQY